MRRAWLKWAVFWLGLILCAYALWHVRVLAGDAASRVGMAGWATTVTLLVVGWCLSVTSWRQYLKAYTGRAPTWRVAVRQVGLLLVGKYLPGGIFGFLARMYDQPGAPRQRLFWAGLAEQAVGVAMPFALGGLLYLVAVRQNMAWMSSAVLLPLVAWALVRLMHTVAVRMPWLRLRAAGSGFPDDRALLSAIVVQLAQQLVWVALVALLARELFGLDAYEALGVAGAFWWAVALGVMAIFVPGGIGVREAAMVGLASLWLDTPQAVLLSVLLRLLSSIMDVGAGCVAALLGVWQGREGEAK